MNERDIYLAALDITDPEARRNYLDPASGGHQPSGTPIEISNLKSQIPNDPSTR